MAQEQICLHGTCVSLNGEGVLILGEPGAGKSDLALRLIDQPGHGISGSPMRGELVSDDQVIVTRHEDKLIASAPSGITGKLEIRGLGIVALDTQPSTPLSLVVKLQDRLTIERLPEHGTFEILGLALPLVEVDGATASAPGPAACRIALVEASKQRRVNLLRSGKDKGNVRRFIRQMRQTATMCDTVDFR